MATTEELRQRANAIAGALRRREAERNLLSETLREARLALPSVRLRLARYRETAEAVLEMSRIYKGRSIASLNLLVTKGLQSILGPEFSYEIVPEDKRNQVEMRQVVKMRRGDRILELDPSFSSGGGVRDVISYCLRQLLWSRQVERVDAIEIIDEPFRNVSRVHWKKVSELIKRFSDQGHIQSLIVTHRPEIAACADKIFHVELVDGVSEVTEQ